MVWWARPRSGAVSGTMGIQMLHSVLHCSLHGMRYAQNCRAMPQKVAIAGLIHADVLRENVLVGDARSGPDRL